MLPLFIVISTDISEVGIGKISINIQQVLDIYPLTFNKHNKVRENKGKSDNINQLLPKKYRWLSNRKKS